LYLGGIQIFNELVQVLVAIGQAGAKLNCIILKDEIILEAENFIVL
jgi:hypothetical protein